MRIQGTTSQVHTCGQQKPSTKRKFELKVPAKPNRDQDDTFASDTQGLSEKCTVDITETI